MFPMLISSNLWKKEFGCLGFELFAGTTVEMVSLASSIKPPNKFNAILARSTTTLPTIVEFYRVLLDTLQVR
ncbi:hypothetical protein VIGAN_UM103900, partial [Vigna angularis var. angularis]